MSIPPKINIQKDLTKGVLRYTIVIMMRQLKIKEETKKSLDALKHPGQTYDGVIRELIEMLKRMKKIRS